MLDYFQLYGWNVKDLTLLITRNCGIFKSYTAHSALPDLVHLCVVRFFRWLQSVTFMPLLPAAFFDAGFSHTFGAVLFETITGRGLAAVLTIFVQTVLLCLQFLNELLNKLNNLLFSLLVGCTNFITGRYIHRLSLHQSKRFIYNHWVG